MRHIFIATTIIIFITLVGTAMLDASIRDYLSGFDLNERFNRNTQTSGRRARPTNLIRNDAQNLTEVIFQFNDWGTWVNEEKMLFEYDTQGRLIEFIWMIWDEDEQEWIYDERLSYTWEDDMLMEIMWELYEEEWVEYLHFAQEFNEQNQVIFAEAWIYIDGEWLDFAITNYDYDEYDRLVTMTNIYYIDMRSITRQNFYYRRQYSYDSLDRADELIKQYSEDGEIWINDEKTTFVFHANDTSEYQVFQDWINNFAMHMNAGGRLWDTPMWDSQTIYEWYDDDWQPQLSSEYLYHPNDKLEYVYWHVYNGTWDPMDREYYLYDEDWILSEIKYHWYDGENWLPWGREFRTYETVSADDVTIPVADLSLSNYPNPFNPETTIAFNLPESGNVRLDIYNICGQKVTTLINKELSAGNHQFVWNGKNQQGNTMPSGIYLYRVDADGGRYTSTKKMLLLK